jgi:hypothetical protein
LLTSALVMVAAICWLGLVAFALQPLPLLDLNAHLQGAAGWIRGANPYLAAIQDPSAGSNSGSGFVYPPYTLPLFAALDFLGRAAAHAGWQIAQLAALGWLTWQLAEPRSPRRLAALSIMVAGFYPVITNLVLGQAGVLMIALLWAGIRTQDRGKAPQAAALIAAGSLLKLFPMVLIIRLARRGQWLAGGLALAIPMAIALVTGPSVAMLWPQYLRSVLFAKISSPTTFLDAQSILAAVIRSAPHVPSIAHPLGIVLAMGVLGSILALAWRFDRSAPLPTGALILAALPLTMPYAWQHYYVLALPLLWIVSSSGWNSRDVWLLGAAGLSYLCLSWLAFTVDYWAMPISKALGPFAGLYTNGSVVGGIVLLLAGARLALRSEPSLSSLPARPASKAA